MPANVNQGPTSGARPLKITSERRITALDKKAPRKYKLLS
jgi:hypothetical protein